MNNPIKAIINMGLARCGTTATSKIFDDGLDGFVSPTGVKELKFFLKQDGLEEYLTCFDYQDGDVIFESSPPYMHSTLAEFKNVIDRISATANDGLDVHLLFHVRNLTKRAFSHYWHDINGHYSIFGKMWSVKSRDDERRYKVRYQKPFALEISEKGNTGKFRVELVEMLQYAISVFGEERVHIAHLPSINDCMRDLLRSVTGTTDHDDAVVPRTPGTAAPEFFPGGDQGTVYEFASQGNKTQSVEIPANYCALLARRHVELLDGDRFNIAELIDMSKTWTRHVSQDQIPEDFIAYLDAQRRGLEALPASCFLANCKDAAVADIASVPTEMAIKKRRVSANEILKLIWEKQSENAQKDGKVTVGRGERLFLHYDMNDVLAQHSGQQPMSDVDLKNWREVLEGRRDYCAKRGINYGMIFAPDTHAVYREELEALDKVTDPRPIQQLLDYYDGPEVFYPLDALRNARDRGEVCDVTDSHWSGFGAYVAYKKCLPVIDPDARVILDKDTQILDQVSVGDLGSKFTPPRKGRTSQVIVKKSSARKVWNNGVTNRGHISFWTNDKSDLGRGMLITDSYGWRFQRFMAESFSSLLVLHSPVFEADMIETYKPDTVISLLAERFAPKVPDDRGGEKCLKMATEKSPGFVLPDFEELMLLR